MTHSVTTQYTESIAIFETSSEVIEFSTIHLSIKLPIPIGGGGGGGGGGGSGA